MMLSWTSGLGLPSMGASPDQEKRPPPPPTKIDFPVYNLLDVPDDASESSLREIHNLLASIRRPQDISTEKLKAFNLRLETDITADRIVPQGSKLFPPLPWEARTCNETEDGEPILMDNGNPYPARERFENLKKELLLDNDDAFRELARLPPKEGRQRVRVAHARKFWTGLERMAQWWDSSLDNYFERPATPELASDQDKMQTDETQSSEIQNSTTTPMDVDNPPTTQTVNGTSSDREEGRQEIVQRYTGRRIGTGQEMPEDIREETVRALAEMAAWPFGCQVSVPTSPPRLTVQKLLFPVRQSFQAARSPKDRQLARSGVMEGPVFVAQCRPETSFRGPEDAPGSGAGEVCDLLRELGAMLLAAQERGRQGATEVRPGEGQWWATKPRWGGATQDTQESNNGEEQPAREDGSDRKRSKFEHPFLASRRASSGRKLSNGEKWKIVQPGPSLWDKRMRYIQIGKDKDSPFDDIYMLSSVNHHVAILHLRIHRRYLDLLTTGESDFPPESDTLDQPWQVLKLRRTRWYDLFDAQERLEVFQGIWTMFHYLLRKQ